MTPVFPKKRYQVVYADPPWTVDLGGAIKIKDFPLMSTWDIAMLPVRDITCDQGVLFLWAIGTRLQDAFLVMRAWGFEYKTVIFNWIKLTNRGNIVKNFGSYGFSSSEFCLLGTRGRPILKPKRLPLQVLMTERGRMCEKPEKAREYIDGMYGNLSRIELFARRRFPGWDAWGNEI